MFLFGVVYILILILMHYFGTSLMDYIKFQLQMF